MGKKEDDMENSHNKQLEQMVCKALSFPDEWKIERCTITHIPSGLTLWIANGPLHLAEYNDASSDLPVFHYKPGFFERFRVWEYVQRMLAVHTIRKLETVLEPKPAINSTEPVK